MSITLFIMYYMLIFYLLDAVDIDMVLFKLG
jgi:hypothetical protein